MEIFIEPPRFLCYGRPISRLRRKILLMHPWDKPSIMATSRWDLPSAYNLTIRCFVAWSPLKVQININSRYRNPSPQKSIKVVMARQTLLQVTILNFFVFLLSLSGPQTVLTVFRHLIWLRNGSMKSTVFRISQLKIRPATLNTDQINANAI